MLRLPRKPSVAIKPQSCGSYMLKKVYGIRCRHGDLIIWRHNLNMFEICFTYTRLRPNMYKNSFGMTNVAGSSCTEETSLRQRLNAFFLHLLLTVRLLIQREPLDHHSKCTRTNCFYSLLGNKKGKLEVLAVSTRLRWLLKAGTRHDGPLW